MIALARSRHPGVTFQVADAETLPFADETFDAVVGNFVLPHLGQHERAVAEWTRVLVPGGMLALSMWDVPEQNRLLGVVSDAVASVEMSAPTGIPAGPPTFRFSPDDALTGLVESAGLKDPAIERICFTHPVPDAEQFWNGIVTGSVRTAALFAGQPPDTLLEIRAAFDRIVSGFSVDGRLEVPVAVKIVSGQKRDRERAQ
jgi:SAM-dependent methyltransferase